MSSAFYFNLDKSKILSSGNGLTYANTPTLQKALINKYLSDFVAKVND